MTHHNTHHASERIRQEYSATLHNLSDNEYYTKIKRAEFQNYTLASPYSWPACCQEVPRPPQADAPHDPWKNSNKYSEKAEVKPDMKNSIATDHLATKPILWRVVYYEK